MKRIALISDHATPRAALGGIRCGGRHEYVRQLAQGLAAGGCLVDVFTRGGGTDASEGVVESWTSQVRIVHVPVGGAGDSPGEARSAHMARFTQFVLDFMKDEGARYHVLHANFFTSALVAADVKAATGIPFVVTFHALGRVRQQHEGDDEALREQLDLEERAVREADGIVAPSPQGRDDLLTLYGASRAKLRLIPCGVDAERFRPVPRRRARAALGIPVDDFLLLHLGRLAAHEGAEDVIRSIACLEEEDEFDAKLLVVGGDAETPDEGVTPEIGRLRRIAEQERVEHKVRFVGQRCGEALRFYFSAADVFVTTPHYASCGMTALEAMACATPVIGSSVGSIKYSVLEGETGFLVPPRDPTAIAGRVRVLRDDALRRAEMGRRGRERVVRAFSWFEVVRSIVALYDDVAGVAPRARQAATTAPPVDRDSAIPSSESRDSTSTTPGAGPQ